MMTIEVTQEMSILVSGEIKHHFLQMGSFAYYEYSPKIKTDVTYEVSDDNKHCAKFYLSDEHMPGPLNKLKKSENGKIVYPSSPD